MAKGVWRGEDPTKKIGGNPISTQALSLQAADKGMRDYRGLQYAQIFSVAECSRF